MRHLPPLIGMIHLGALPGSPGYDGDFPAVVERAIDDARTLAASGFDGLMIENFGDAPFFATDVPKITVAALTNAIVGISTAVEIPFGVNVLRNDGEAAIAIAAATGAAFIRINVLSGTMFTDQGIIEGRAAAVGRLRAELAPDVAILADVHVKHATPPPGLTITDAAADLWERSGADAIVVSGKGTGSPAQITDVRAVRSALPDALLYLGSGLAVGNLAEIRPSIDGAIVGSSLKIGGPDRPVDGDLAAGFAAAWIA